jgi:hypothetical protein
MLVGGRRGSGFRGRQFRVSTTESRPELGIRNPERRRGLGAQTPSSEIKLVDVVFIEDEGWSEQDLAALDHL